MKRALTLSFCVVFVTGCSNDNDDDFCAQDVSTRVDEDADFDAYETFAVVEVEDFDGMGGMGMDFEIPDDAKTNIDTANRAAADELEERGLDEVDQDEDPDLYVVSAAVTQEKDGTYWECIPGPYWWGWWGYWYWDPCAWLDPIAFTYTEGSLVVALVDADTNEPVFGGGAQEVLECSSNVDTDIERAVSEIFEDYPD